MFWISGAHRIHKVAQIIAWGAFQSGQMAAAAHWLAIQFLYGQINHLLGQPPRRRPFAAQRRNHAMHPALFGMVINLTAAAQPISCIGPVIHIGNQWP